MNLIEFCIRRPAFTIVMSLIITVVGFIGFSHLPVRWIPDVNLPLVSIYTSYPGASANLVESQITTPIETALAGVSGVDTITSHSKEGQSNINLNFKLGYSLNTAVEDVRSALQRSSGDLPTGAKPPVISKADTANSMPILYLAFSDSRRSDKEVSDYVKQFILPRVQTVDGVAGVVTYGERISAMHIWLDPMKMASSNVTVDDINKVLNEQNVQVPSGQIRSASRYYSVVTNEILNSASEFNDLIVRHDQNQTVRLKDVGTAVVDAANSDSSFRVEGHPAVAVGIIPQSNANPLEVAKHVKKEFAAIKKNLPTGMEARIVFDQTTYIESSVDHVYQSVFEAIVLVLMVIYLFLASWRAALIPIVTIPICLIGTCAVMDLLGFSINTITLMAFVLAIGLVVDDAIVMLENIIRYIELGLKPFAAAIKGGREIIFPIIAMTLTLAAVYAPIAMTSGILGAIFKEFALTLAVTVIISGFVALTLSPMMCSRFLTAHKNTSGYENWLNTRLDAWRLAYRGWLTKVLNHKRYVLFGLIAVGALGYALFKHLPAELVPGEDMDQVNVFVAAPRNASYAYTNSYVKQLENIYKKMPDATSYLADVGNWAPSRAFQIINLVPRSQRSQSAEAIANELSKEVKNFPGVDVYAYPEQSPLAWSAGSDGAKVSLEVMSSSDYKDLHKIMQQMITVAKNSKVFQRVDSKLKWDGEQFELKIDREKASEMKIPMLNVTNTISTLLAGRTIGRYEYGGNQYDVILQMNKEALSNPNVVSQLYVRSLNNKMVPLSDLVTLKETTSPEMLPHFERMRSDTLNASLAPGYTIADGVDVLQQIAKDVLPDYAKYSFTGEAHNYLDSNGKMAMTFLLALIFIYLILVAQFESFIDPLIILFTVPFAMIGGLLLLKLAGGTLNIYSDIGLVTLIGLIAKHGILITEFANRQRALGKSIQEAVVDAASARLRPILMTTAAMVLGAVPLALAMGAGSETRHQIGWVVVGGLLLGTFFSLVVVPVAYTYLARFKRVAVDDCSAIPSEAGNA
ncbi:MAG: efflux RND transporter permease subunit [Gammaproteobacteria bacterium]